MHSSLREDYGLPWAEVRRPRPLNMPLCHAGGDSRMRKLLYLVLLHM